MTHWPHPNLQIYFGGVKTMHHAIIRRLGLEKFMVVPHYTYMVLKILSINVVISKNSSLKQSYIYDIEGCSLTESHVL